MGPAYHMTFLQSIESWTRAQRGSCLYYRSVYDVLVAVKSTQTLCSPKLGHHLRNANVVCVGKVRRKVTNAMVSI